MHDMNGTPLSIGDSVNVPCVIKETYGGDEYCNVTLKTKKSMYPSNEPSAVTLNTKQVVKATKWVLTSDDDGHDYCIPAEYLGLFSKWVEAQENPSDVVTYGGPDFADYALGGSPLSLTFENPEYEGQPLVPNIGGAE